MAGMPFNGWDYESYPDDETRSDRCASILVDLSQGHVEPHASCADSRPIHHRMFDGMHEPDQAYFAGHFRGEPFPLLHRYEVGVKADTRVGTASQQVDAEMQRFRAEVDQSFGVAIPQILAHGDANQKLIASVGVACTHLVDFLSIHPYANGNGHIGRFIVWAVLHACGIHPRRWPLNDKIPQPYSDLLSEFRNQNRIPLVRFVLAHI